MCNILSSRLGGLLFVLLLLSCDSRKQTGETQQEQPRRHFKTEVLLKTTPVKDQGRSSLCWVYAMLATIETEHLMQGDSVNLSADFVARHFLQEQVAERCYGERRRETGDGRRELPFTTRGMGSMLPRLIHTYGLTHYDAYHGRQETGDGRQEKGGRRQEKGGRRQETGDRRQETGVLCRKLEQLCSSPLSRGGETMARAEELMDELMGPLPRYVFMLGAEYTALEFAHSVCRAGEYESVTSFTHHPFYQRFPLEVPDNRYHDTFLNLPLDSMMALINKALRSGHPVCWEGDTSEPGFRWSEGVAELSPSQEARQRDFESGRTTDDHCMEIVGIAHGVRS